VDGGLTKKAVSLGRGFLSLARIDPWTPLLAGKLNNTSVAENDWSISDRRRYIDS
jgi:hypothetical protein